MRVDFAGARAAALALPIALAVACAEPAPRSAPPAAEPEAPIAVDPVPASFAPLRALLAGHDAAPEVRRAATLRLVALLRAAGRAGDDDADPAAAAALRALVAADPSALGRADVQADLLEVLVAAGARPERYALARHLACPEAFDYRGEPAAPNPQDHPRAYWDRWETIHPEPIALGRARLAKRKTRPPAGAPPFDEETRYRPLYPACKATGAERVEAWLAVAEWHASGDDGGGPFRSNRAIEAYRHAIAADPVSGLRARALLGEALVRRGARAPGVHELVAYLDACDRGAAVGCDRATEQHAIAVVGEALTYRDLDGPDDAEPDFVPDDILDTEPDPAVVERTLRGLVLARLDDASLVPSGRAFTLPVRMAVASTLRGLEMHALAAEVLESTMALAPDGPRTPEILAALGVLYQRKAWTSRVPSGLPWATRSVAARERLLATLAPDGAWGRAHPAADAGARQRSDLAARTLGDLAAVHLGIASNLERAAADGPLPIPVDEALPMIARARVAIARADAAGRMPGQGASARADLDVAELSVRARAGVVSAAAWKAAADELAQLAVGADRRSAERAAERRIALAAIRIEYEARRFEATHGAEGTPRPPLLLSAPYRLPPRVDPLQDEIVEAIAARVTLAEARGSEGYAATPLVDAAQLEAAYGRAAEAAALLDRALAVACKTSHGFGTFVARVELARAAHDRAALAELRARHADPARTCAHSKGELAAGAALFK